MQLESFVKENSEEYIFCCKKIERKVSKLETKLSTTMNCHQELGKIH